MEISQVKIKLAGDGNHGRLKAFAMIVIDGMLAVRDIRVIDGPGGLFCAMPSSRIQDHCPRCDSGNHLRAKFCGECGVPLDHERATRGLAGRAKLHADVTHPICAEARHRIDKAVLAAYRAEAELAGLPGYTCRFSGPYGDEADAMPAAVAVAGAGARSFAGGAG